MARIRSIKPDFFTSETIAALPLSARLTFIGLWTHVDDNGVCTDNERLIVAALYPLDDDPHESLMRTHDDLLAIEKQGLIERYMVGERTYLFITSWDEHQKVQHPGKPRFPRPGQDPLTSGNASGRAGNRRSSRGSHEDLTRPHEGLTPEQGAGSREQGGRSRETNPSSDAADAAPDEQPGRRPDVDRLCLVLADLVEANGSKRPPIGKRWRKAARLMLDIDGRDPVKAENLIKWCQADEFWRSNVLSMPTFRARYDQLRLKALEDHEHRKATASKPPPQHVDLSNPTDVAPPPHDPFADALRGTPPDDERPS